jgi:anti-sigma B factor antagonist
MAGEPIMEVYSVGPTTVVGFGGRDVLDSVNLAACREELVDLITREQCRVLAFDLTGVKLIPSGLLGLLASIRQLGAEVHLYNPSDDVREVLSVTNLDRLMPVHEIDLGDRRSD